MWWEGNQNKAKPAACMKSYWKFFLFTWVWGFLSSQLFFWDSLRSLEVPWGSSRFLEVPWGCLFMGAYFWGAYFRGAYFWGAYFRGAYFWMLIFVMIFFVTNICDTFMWRNYVTNFWVYLGLFNHCELWDRSTFDLVSIWTLD